MAKYNISEKANDPNYVSPYETGDGKYQSKTTNGKSEGTIRREARQIQGGGGTLTADSIAQASGIASSASARNAVKNGESVVSTKGGDIHSTYINLMQDYNKLQKQYEQEQATREGIEANASIEKQQQEQALKDAQAAAGATGDEPSAIEKLGSVQTDPVAQAMADAATESENLLNTRLTELKSFVDSADADMQLSLKNIENLAKSQTALAQKENARVERAARVAGIVAGRGQYSALEHEGIVSEVIQDGLARIQKIEYEAQTATLEAKKAHREFRYKAFVEATDLVESLNETKRQAIIDISDRLREVEQDARDKMKFDQEQADRNAFLLAPELQGMTDEEITKAAYANGIEPGALLREVQAYSQEQETYDLDTQLTKEKLLSEQQSRNIEWQKYVEAGDGTDSDLYEAMSAAELKSFSADKGWEPPPNMPREMIYQIERDNAGATPETKARIAWDSVIGVERSAGETAALDVKSSVAGDKDMEKKIKGLAKDLGTSVDDIYDDETFKTLLGEAKVLNPTAPTDYLIETVVRLNKQQETVGSPAEFERKRAAFEKANPGKTILPASLGGKVVDIKDADLSKFSDEPIMPNPNFLSENAKSALESLTK